MSTEPSAPQSEAPSKREASFDDSPIHSLVHGIRQCVRVGGIGRIAIWLAIAAGIAVALDLSQGFSPDVRAGLVGTILLIAAILAIIYLFFKPSKISMEDATRKLESTHPEFGQMLRTARDASVANSGVSPVLKAELFRRATLHLCGLNLAKLKPAAPARKWLLAGIAAILGLCVYLSVRPEAPVAFARLLLPYGGITYTKVTDVTQDHTFNRNRLPRAEARVTGRPPSTVVLHITKEDGSDESHTMNPLGGGRYEITLPAAEKTFAFRIEAGDSQPATGSMQCVDPAEFVSSSSRIVFPDYIGQPPVEQQTADVETVEGATAELKFKMSAPMSSATLKLPGGKLVPLKVNGDELSTALTLALNGDEAELTGTDARGHDIEPVQFKHKGVQDKLPVVEWIEPTKDIDATAIAEIPLRFRVRDDYGIASYGVILEARGEKKEIISKTITAKDLRDLSEMTAAALETFPLNIRDNVRVYGWATDHKPRGHATAVSKLVAVNIRQFQMRWMLGKSASGKAVKENDLKKLEELITLQRAILSDSFAAIQSPPWDEAGITGFSTRETKLQQETTTFYSRVKEEGEWPADEINLLAAASNQMGESATAWSRIMPRAGFDRADSALSTLLELRKNLMTLQMKCDDPSLVKKPSKPPVTLTDLAKEAERIAREERDVSKQLQEKGGTPENMTAIGRQQDVANSDTGELHAHMMDHPEATNLVLSQMADAENQVLDATRETRSADPAATAPQKLLPAAETLEALAKQLRALDEANMDETLAKMAEEAKKAAEEAKKEEGQQAGEKPAEKPPEGPKPGEKPGDGKKESESAQAGKKPGEKPGQKPGEGKSPGEGNSKEPSEQASNKPGEGKGEGGEPSPGEGGEATASNESNKKSDEPGADKPGDPEAERKEALEKAARQAAANDDVLKHFAEQEAKAGKDSRFDSLRKETGSETMEQKLGALAEGKGNGKKTAEELQALASALEKERETRLQTRLENLAKSREKAAELKKQGEAKRDAERTAAREREKINDGGFSFNKPEEPPLPGKGSGTESEKPGDSPGRGLRQLARELVSYNDPELGRIAAELDKMAPDLSDFKPVSAAERRLAQLMEELSGMARGDTSEGGVPPAYRRAVEDYYRALSDDFGDEK